MYFTTQGSWPWDRLRFSKDDSYFPEGAWAERLHLWTRLCGRVSPGETLPRPLTSLPAPPFDSDSLCCWMTWASYALPGGLTVAESTPLEFLECWCRVSSGWDNDDLESACVVNLQEAKARRASWVGLRNLPGWFRGLQRAKAPPSSQRGPGEAERQCS